jgi:hypothetical protein
MNQSALPRLRTMALLTLFFVGTSIAITQRALAADPFEFAWSVPGSVAVTVDQTKDTVTTQFRYRLIAEQDPESDGILLHRRDAALVSLNGDEPGDDRDARLVRGLLLLSPSVPSMRISETGAFEGFVGGEEAVLDHLLSVLVPADAKRMANLPDAAGAVVEEAAEMWNYMVGFWPGREIAEGETTEFEHASGLFGPTVKQTITARHLGAADACARCVRLGVEANTDSGALRDAFIDMMRALLLENGLLSQAETLSEDLESVRRVVTAEIVTDTRTLQPYAVMVESRMTLEGAAWLSGQEYQRDEYRFRWPAE